MNSGRGPIVAAVVLGSLAYLCAVGLLAVAAWLIARASQQPPVLTLTVAAVSVRALAIGRSGFRYAERLVGHEGAFRGLAALRVQMYEEIERRGPAKTRLLGRGDLLQRVVGDVDAMQDLPLRVVLPWAQAVVVGVVSVCIAGWLLPWAGFALLIGLTLAATVVPAVAMAVARDADRRLAPARGRLAGAMLTALQAAEDLRTVRGADRAVGDLAAADSELEGLALTSARGAGVAAGLLSLIQGLVIVASATAGIAGVIDGTLEGVLLAVVVLLPLAAFEASLSLPAAALALRRVRASAERLDEFTHEQGDDAVDLSAGNRVAQGAMDAASGSASTGLVLTGAEVTWPGAASPAVSGIDLHLSPGERVAIVGPSGSGKSTLAAALVGFLDVVGSYRIDGRDAEDLSGDELRSRIGLLTQQAHVFDTSLEENLRLARPSADLGELHDVVRRVRLDPWVADLPRGLAQPMGEAGLAMSGGQRQRIGLARMLLADFAWLVLDEPTENLDLDTADALVDDVFSTTEGTGLILITHRMVDALRCDRIVVLREGRIETQGSPDEVKVASGWFADALATERDGHRWRSSIRDLPAGVVVDIADVRPLFI
jgi:ATP-binding cassette, subfamily C, bacterial CydCD